MKINQRTAFRVTGTALMLSLITILSSCLKTKDQDYVQPYAAISVLNAYTGEESFNFFFDGVLANTQPLIYKQNSLYLQVYANYNMVVTIRSAAADTVIADGAVPLNGGKYYTLFIAPNIDESSDAAATGVLAEDDSSAPSGGNAKVRFVNLTSDAGSFDIYTDEASGAEKVITDTLFGSKAYLKVSSFKEVNPEAARYLQIHEAGKTNPLIQIPLSLEAGKTYTIYSCGLLNADPGTATSFNAVVEENQF